LAWPPQFLDELIDRTDLVDLVGEPVLPPELGQGRR